MLVLFHLGSDDTVGVPSIIPDIKCAYLDIERDFVSTCNTEGSPTVEEVQDFCIDMIECALPDVPPDKRHEDDIRMAKTMAELARIICFRLSKWISFDFFSKVIAEFQPALKSIKDRLASYEEQLKPLLMKKLIHIAELRER